ncbi:hypothetical protein HK096_001553, partial [Nowakowskiella sp. JEL0078]
MFSELIIVLVISSILGLIFYTYIKNTLKTSPVVQNSDEKQSLLPIHTSTCYLFGCQESWQLDRWSAVDDRVRGGRSQSYLTATPPKAVVFSGSLDTTALGGAGFASHRTAPGLLATLNADFSNARGLEVFIVAGDLKTYALNFSCKELTTRPDGRVESAIEFKANFQGEMGVVRIAWDDFLAYYRGRKVEGDNVPCFEPGNVKSLSIMCQSYFDAQKGDF